MSIAIDPEFKRLIPSISNEERDQLARNIAADGCRDPLVLWNGILLDGHHRYAICMRRKIPFKTETIDLPDRDAAKVWIIRNQFGRRNLTTYARAELALKLEPLLAAKAKERKAQAKGERQGAKKSDPQISAGETREQVAKAAGVSHETIRAAKYVRDNADQKTVKRLRTDPNLKLHRVAKDTREKAAKSKRHKARMKAAKGTAVDSRIVVGDFRKHAGKVADGSVSLIFTDPPYGDDTLLPALAEFAAAKLCDGGSMLCYVGQTQIPTAIDAFRRSLRYWWTICCLHSGGATVMREYGINAWWKAVLWFVKGTRDDNSVFVSDVMSGGREKDRHDWQQAESEASYWIERLCPKDGSVVDPFLGGGTTGAAATKLGRRWIGFEIDEETAVSAGTRIGK